MSTPRMQGRHVLISGGSAGMGREAARLCAREGAAVTVIGRKRDRVEATAAELGVHGVVADMTDEAAAIAAVEEAAAKMGAIDGLLNCIGNSDFRSLEDTDLERWNTTFLVNITTHYLATRAALPYLRKGEGSAIVNVSALAGIVPGVSNAAYSAAKAAVIQFTKTLAAQLAPTIRANSVCPGAVNTQRMQDGYLSDKTPEQIAAFVGRYAFKRLAEPEEVANLLLFLLSNEAAFITGCNYVVDGGRAYH